MAPGKNYRKATSKRFLREKYQAILAVTPVDDPKYLTTVRLLSRLEGHDSSVKLKATDYPERHKKKPEPEPQLGIDDGEPLSEELQALTDEYEKLERAWKAYFAKLPLPENSPELVRAVVAAVKAPGSHTPAEFQIKGMIEHAE